MRHGLGKFEACGNYVLTAGYIYYNIDDQLGESESFGWYGKFAGKIKGRGPFFAIVSEDSQGFVDVTYYDSKKELDEKWVMLEADYEEFQGPSEDDITTEDHCKFYQYGKLILKLEENADHKQALRDYMEQEQFWPNVWFISDHGNAHRIDLTEDK